jgi:hypothetical protein
MFVRATGWVKSQNGQSSLYVTVDNTEVVTSRSEQIAVFEGQKLYSQASFSLKLQP